MDSNDDQVTSDLPEDFFDVLGSVAADLSTEDSEVSPIDMLSVMYSESGVRSTAWNDNPKELPPDKRYNASGLIQFMPATLRGLGWTKGHAAFRQLTATEQLEYVKMYYTPYRGHLHTVAGLYLATFLPALIKHADEPDFVLTAKEGVLPWAYGPNRSFDANKDLNITVQELEDAVGRNCKGNRWEHILARATGHGLGEYGKKDA